MRLNILVIGESILHSRSISAATLYTSGNVVTKLAGVSSIFLDVRNFYTYLIWMSIAWRYSLWQILDGNVRLCRSNIRLVWLCRKDEISTQNSLNNQHCCRFRKQSRTLLRHRCMLVWTGLMLYHAVETTQRCSVRQTDDNYITGIPVAKIGKFQRGHWSVHA